jgi:hypothetical protein
MATPRVSGQLADRNAPFDLPDSLQDGVQLWRMAMSELDDFVTSVLGRQTDAERALVGGDPEPRLAITSRQDPVTVLGAKVPLRRGWDDVSDTLRWLSGR